MKNIITIDIDTDRETPIIINKPPSMYPKENSIDEMLRGDIKDLTSTLLYIASMLEEEDEVRVIGEITDTLKKRYEQIQPNTEGR